MNLLILNFLDHFDFFNFRIFSEYSLGQCELQSKDPTKKNMRQILTDYNILPLIHIDLVDTSQIKTKNIFTKDQNQNSPPAKRTMKTKQ